jgi:hypothetical protein
MSSVNQPHAVLPGDVLLYRGNGWTSWAIRAFDGTEVSHAGLCVNGEIAEAQIKAGLIKRPIATSIAGCDWVEVRRLKTAVDTMSPVIKVAEAYLNDRNRYAYEQIILLAGICMTRKLDLQNPLLRKIVRRAMQEATEWLRYLHGQGKEPMICSEFVYRTYDEAWPDPDDLYSLEILSQKVAQPGRRHSRFRRRRKLLSGEFPAETPNVHPESLLAQLQATGETLEDLPAATRKMAAALPEPAEELDWLIQQYQAEMEGAKTAGPRAVGASPEVSADELLRSTRRLTAEWADATVRKEEAENKRYGVAPAASEWKPITLAEILADFVTPGDLLKSPSLNAVCRLGQERIAVDGPHEFAGEGRQTRDRTP